ncbi:TetR/AcrR family transcriptional regulator [Phreatobacter sp. AB_2022a]|uniref:TetR/AcrR family transcriptional regulator n=1 Tax=Phreatobacter sp. AB_2022a TaxID=3003134 RepID=UPI0022874785|nr:TetR/AcrR family transcriptional regulator [Phreatobacter sp. AB_2022a]MCZ0732785.1 TetR/AcrR family transcriptional regulator [Phreatobacter sp. AB_2022a]
MPSDKKQAPGTGARASRRSGAGAKGVKLGLRGSVVRNPAQREEQRRQILAAAGQVFARKGYEGSTMDDIAAEMGCSKGILYYQFQSKQDLIVETRRVASGSAADRLEEIAAQPLPVLERMELAVRDLIVTNFDDFSRHVILSSITQGLDAAHIAQVRIIERRYEKALIALLEEGIAAGLFVSGDVKAMAFTVIQTCLSPARWFRAGKGSSAEEVTDVVTGMVLRGLQPLPADRER